MDIKEFIQNFADQLEDTDPAILTPETRFHDLEEWSSLVALSILAMVDEEYDVQLKADQMRQAVTLADLFNTVKEVKG